MISGKNTPRFAECSHKQFNFNTQYSPEHSTPINTLSDLMKSPISEHPQKNTDPSVLIDSPLCSKNTFYQENKDNIKRGTKIKTLAQILPKKICMQKQINLQYFSTARQSENTEAYGTEKQRDISKDHSRNKGHHRGLEVSLTRKTDKSQVKQRSCSKKIKLSIVNCSKDQTQKKAQKSIRGLSPKINDPRKTPHQTSKSVTKSVIMQREQKEAVPTKKKIKLAKLR